MLFYAKSTNPIFKNFIQDITSLYNIDNIINNNLLSNVYFNENYTNYLYFSKETPNFLNNFYTKYFIKDTSYSIENDFILDMLKETISKNDFMKTKIKNKNKSQLIEWMDFYNRYDDSEINFPTTIPEGKFYYPEPFVASPSFMHENLWFIHILHYQYWLWFFFITIIMFYFITFINVVRWCNMRTRPRRETRGVSRSKCADLITATVPVSWAASIIVAESVDATDYYDGFGTGEIVVGVRAYQWGWEYYYPKTIDLQYNINPSYNQVIGNSLKYSNSTSSTLSANKFWKFYQQKNLNSTTNTPSNLLISPTHKFNYGHPINYSESGLELTQPSNAFKRINYFTKTTPQYLYNNSSDFSLKYNKLNSLYLNESSLLNSSDYGTVRQHSFSNLNSNLNSHFLEFDNYKKFQNLTLNLTEPTKKVPTKFSLSLQKSPSETNWLKNSYRGVELLTKDRLRDFRYDLSTLNLNPSTKQSGLWGFNFFKSIKNVGWRGDMDRSWSLIKQNYSSLNKFKVEGRNNGMYPTYSAFNLVINPGWSLYIPNITLYSDYDFLNTNAYESLEDLIWETPFSGYETVEAAKSSNSSTNNLLINFLFPSMDLKAFWTMFDQPFGSWDRGVRRGMFNYELNQDLFKNYFLYRNQNTKFLPENLGYDFKHASFDVNSLMESFKLDAESYNPDLEVSGEEALFQNAWAKKASTMPVKLFEGTLSSENVNNYTASILLNLDFSRIISPLLSGNRLYSEEFVNYLPTYFSDKFLPNTSNLNYLNYFIFPFDSNVEDMEGSYANTKTLKSIYNTAGLNILNSDLSGLTSTSYLNVLNAFTFTGDFNLPTENTSNLNSNLSSSLTNSSNILKLSSQINVAKSAKGYINGYGAMQKVFKTRLDEQRSHMRLTDVSNSYVKYPLISETRVNYEDLIKKNKNSYFALRTYKTSLISNFSDIFTNFTSTNNYLSELPFLISVKNDATRYLWFDWYTKWTSLEVQPSAISKNSLSGILYNRKTLAFENESVSNTVFESERYFDRIARARRNYTSNWVASPYMYTKIAKWYKLYYTNINLFEENSLRLLKGNLRLAKLLWIDDSTLSSLDKGSSSVNTSNTVFNQLNSSSNVGLSKLSPLKVHSNYTPSFSLTNVPKASYFRPIDNMDWEINTLVDIMSKREFLYRQFINNLNTKQTLLNTVVTSPTNPLLQNIKNTYVFNNPTTFSHEFSREFFYSKQSFLKFLLLKDVLNYNISLLNSLPVNMDKLVSYLYFYNNSEFASTKFENPTLNLKNQFKPMRKGITNMIKLHTTGAVAMPIEIRLHFVASSKDVVHSWAIPSAGIKIDCVPGFSSHRVAIFLATGIFWGQCMEVCGRYHHWMPIVVYFMKRDLFFLWCTHFVHYSSVDDFFTSIDRQMANKSYYRNLNTTVWLNEIINN
uniref:Cytochrome c oxidase polypeptide II n=1 Tax=Strombidium cf. sulcatum TaxID=2793073 RepID=A0A7T0M4N5_9SPIT|nr:cytochrome c oxidase subunit 2 [Strombidium cf. sulcatum]QPL15970.1 cytochrome c oxidase subunit 2 [Strombidium cf. sulcatum]